MISKHVLALHLASASDAHAIPPRSWWDGHLPHGMALFTEELGMDPSGGSGKDYSPWEGDVMARLNVGYPPSMPGRADFARAAERFGRFVAASRGCRHWVLPNETNHSQEWASGPQYPEDVADWYHLARKAIRERAGPGHEVVLGAVAPYCAEVKYPGNERGDWVAYQLDVLRLLQAKHGEVPDGIAVHAYARGAHPAAITDRMPMDNPAFADRSCSFQTYRDLLLALPEPLWGVPAYITEFDEIDAWLDLNTGIVEAAAAEVALWNRKRGNRNVVRKLCLYRWCCDRWSIQGKRNLHMDIARAAARGDKWAEGEGPMAGEWLQVYYNACERGFYAQGNVPVLTIPIGMQVFWLEDPSAKGKLDRPEMAFKDVTLHPEVYEGRFSGSGMFQDTTGRLYLVTDRIYVQNGRPVLGSCKYMHELRGIQGGGCLGIADGDGPFVGGHERPPSDEAVFAAGAVWGGWYNWQQPEKTWATLATPQVVPSQGFVRLVLRFHRDYAKWGGFCYDALQLEQLAGTEPGPAPGPGGPDIGEVRRVVREELDRTRLGV